jgi:hypothetical protein
VPSSKSTSGIPRARRVPGNDEKPKKKRKTSEELKEAQAAFLEKAIDNIVVDEAVTLERILGSSMRVEELLVDMAEANQQHYAKVEGLLEGAIAFFLGASGQSREENRDSGEKVESSDEESSVEVKKKDKGKGKAKVVEEEEDEEDGGEEDGPGESRELGSSDDSDDKGEGGMGVPMEEDGEEGGDALGEPMEQ